jgi:hypothetical protein
MGIEHERLYTVISVDEILYILAGGALSQNLINPPLSQKEAFRPDRVYLRTRKGVFLTQYRSLAKLRKRLDPYLFFPLHRLLLVSFQKITEIDSSARMIGVALANGSRECLSASRRSFQVLCQQMGLLHNKTMKEDPNVL